MAVEASYEERLRAAALAWPDGRQRQGLGTVRYDELAGFTFEGQRLPLMDRQRGIRKPA